MNASAGSSTAITSGAGDVEFLDTATMMHILPSVYGILCIVGVGANCLVIYTLLACKTKGVSDIYVLSLATADLLFLLGMPFTIHQLVRDRDWVFGQFICKVVTVLDVTNQFTTVGIVTVLCVDRVQKRFTWMLPGLEDLSNRGELNRLGLFSLEHPRLTSDLIEVHKIMRGKDRVNNPFPRVGESKTGGHRFK
eukprot:g26181.t1